MGHAPFEDVLESRLTDLKKNLVHDHQDQVDNLQREISNLRGLLSKSIANPNEAKPTSILRTTAPCPPKEDPPDLPALQGVMPGMPGEIADTDTSIAEKRITSKKSHQRYDSATGLSNPSDTTLEVRPSGSFNALAYSSSLSPIMNSPSMHSVPGLVMQKQVSANGLNGIARSIGGDSSVIMPLSITQGRANGADSQEKRPTFPSDGLNSYRSSQGSLPGGKSCTSEGSVDIGSSNMMRPMKSTDAEDAFTFTMLPVWVQTNRLTVSKSKAHHAKASAFSNIGNDEDDSDDDSDIDLREAHPLHSKSSEPSRFQEVILRFQFCFAWMMSVALFLQTPPNALRRMLWDIIGILFIAYEFVVLPLALLDLPDSVFLTTTGWVIRCYWTFDFPASFFKSYHQPNGMMERRPGRVAMKYVRTWMLFDLGIIIIDWLETAMSDLDSISAARMGKTVRLFRWMRMVRLFRLLRIQERLPDFARAAAYFMHSERFTIVLAMIKMIIFLVAMAHFMACCWYGLGIDSQQDNTWLTNRQVNEVTLQHRYAESMHWALTQYIGAADIYPTNFQERTFAIVALIFGFLISVSVVSSLTSNLTRLQIVTARSATQMSMLNQYLYDNHISTKIALRVQRNVQYALEQEKKNTPESRIDLLSLVSGPLRVELHYEINLPILSWHDFFSCYNMSNSPAMRRICHMAISRLALCRGDILFNQGEIPPKPSVFFCLTGKFHYQRYFEGGLAGRLQTVKAHHICCEPVLWTQWVHLGQMRARMESNLLVIHADLFQSIASQFQTREFYPKKYAMEYVDALTHSDFDEVTDLTIPEFNIQEICLRIFPAAFTRHINENLGDKRWSNMSAAKATPWNASDNMQMLKKAATKAFKGR